MRTRVTSYRNIDYCMLQAALAELTDGAAGGQVPQGPSGGAAAGTETDQEAAAAEGAAARGTCADGDQSMGQRQQQVPPQRLQPSLRRRRRVRLPSHIKRLTKVRCGGALLRLHRHAAPSA